MRKITLLISLSLFFVVGVSAQKGKVLDARNSLASNNLKKAKAQIDEAGQDAQFKNDPQFYFWKGYIYKELYKAYDKGKDPQSQLREKSFQSYIKLMEYRSVMSQDTLNSALKALNYLSSQYWNDAVLNADTTNYEIAIENYEKFKEGSMMVDPSNDLSDKDIKFSMKIATVYVSLYEVRGNTPAGDVYFEKAKDEYRKIINIDNKHRQANYNLGIHFYNRAVNIIKDLDVATSLEDLAEKEDVCVELFLQALPYMTTAYEIEPSKRETLIGLTGIYWSLNDIDKYHFYQEKLNELE